jgi:hypothetical protein
MKVKSGIFLFPVVLPLRPVRQQPAAIREYFLKRQ